MLMTFEDGLARWTVTGPPPAPDSRTAVVATEDTLYFGSGFE
jgi:hypothetical protein